MSPEDDYPTEEDFAMEEDYERKLANRKTGKYREHYRHSAGRSGPL